MISVVLQISIAKTEPGDENNQDISALLGKWTEDHAKNDSDSYGYFSALCCANQGVMKFVEMFKVPIKVLHPLLTATQWAIITTPKALRAVVQQPRPSVLKRIGVGPVPQ
ncbi:MAG: hypothetical protein GPOALKHO_000484 [Sodalis sp.]|nr:MAG: hypothetical protein GPOALKHO_000484 [Sodalis sp.]